MRTNPLQAGITCLGLACIQLLLAPSVSAKMTVSSFDGAVTAEELSSFNDYVTTLEPASDNIGNTWAQGDSGENTKAMGLVYLIDGNRTTLDQMIRFCDAVLSERNDLAPAPVGQYTLWTGGIDPAWPNSVTSDPIGTGGEQGDPVGHLASCAYLILKTEDLYEKEVTIGDPYGYGTTYLERAKKFLSEADYSMSNHILSRLLDLSRDNRMYFANDSAYKPGDPVPWNQQMMFNYAFQNLYDAHVALGNETALAARYEKIMNASLNWFFEGGGSTTTSDEAGNKVYEWQYAVGSSSAEDSNHGSLDVAGFARAYMTGEYGITSTQMKRLANVFVDLMILGSGRFAGRVDGTSGTGHAANTTYVRSGYLFLAEFRPDAYESMMSADLKEGGTTTSTDRFSRFLWVKHQRSSNST